MSKDFRDAIIEATMSFDAGAYDAMLTVPGYDAGTGEANVEPRSGDEKISDGEISFLLPAPEVVEEFVKISGALGIPFEALRFVEGYDSFKSGEVEIRLPSMLALTHGEQLKKLGRILAPMSYKAVEEEFSEFVDGLADELSEANPFHGRDGKFTSADKLAKRGGSISLRKFSKKKYGVKGGKFDRKARRWRWDYEKKWSSGWTGKVCGRSARQAGKNVRCQDGKEGWGESVEISTNELVERLRRRAERVIGLPRGFFGQPIGESDRGLVRLADLL